MELNHDEVDFYATALLLSADHVCRQNEKPGIRRTRCIYVLYPLSYPPVIGGRGWIRTNALVLGSNPVLTPLVFKVNAGIRRNRYFSALPTELHQANLMTGLEPATSR